MKIDEPLLTEIAAQTGGRYFRAKDSEALSRIFRQIDSAREDAGPGDPLHPFDEATRPFILLGLCALALELLLNTTLVVRVP